MKTAAGSGAPVAMAVGAAFIAALGAIALFADDFGRSSLLFFAGPFASRYAFGNMLASAGPLLIAGLGVSFAFASRNFNLGGEGQLYSGGLAATAVCLALGAPTGGAGFLPPFAVQGLAIIAAAASGALLAGASGWMKRAAGVDELISSFLVSASVVLFVDALIAGVFQDPASNFITTLPIGAEFRFARLLPPSTLGTGAFLALALAALSAFAMRKTLFGFELRMTGANAEFARYCGVDTGRYSVLPMGLSGALHGVAGAAIILGSQYKAMRGFSGGAGWSAITVALIARNNPLAAIPAALFVAWLDAGAKAVMVGSDMSYEIIAVVQAVVLFLVTARSGRGSP